MDRRTPAAQRSILIGLGLAAAAALAGCDIHRDKGGGGNAADDGGDTEALGSEESAALLGGAPLTLNSSQYQMQLVTPEFTSTASRTASPNYLLILGGGDNVF